MVAVRCPYLTASESGNEIFGKTLLIAFHAIVGIPDITKRLIFAGWGYPAAGKYWADRPTHGDRCTAVSL
jgi:hypothetical protein